MAAPGAIWGIELSFGHHSRGAVEFMTSREEHYGYISEPVGFFFQHPTELSEEEKKPFEDLAEEVAEKRREASKQRELEREEELRCFREEELRKIKAVFEPFEKRLNTTQTLLTRYQAKRGV